jgi:hypothetical protein
MKMEAPKFNLKASNLGFASNEALEAEMNKPQGKSFEPGNYDLQIVSADFHANKTTGSIYCEGDETWFNVVVVAQGADERTTKYWIQVPTSRVHFGAKKTLFVYKKFVEFMAAIGESVTTDNLDKIVPKYFSDPGEALVGFKFNADIGYEGAHIQRSEDGCRIITAAGKPLEEEDGTVIVAPDFGAAKQILEGVNDSRSEKNKIKLSFANIVKFTPKQKASKAKAVKTDDDNGW